MSVESRKSVVLYTRTRTRTSELEDTMAFADQYILARAARAEACLSSRSWNNFFVVHKVIDHSELDAAIPKARAQLSLHKETPRE